MENNTYYLEFLYNRHSDIVWTSSILIIIGCVIGIIGNAIVIYFYFFRIKERGERYFIPWLAVVDLLGCIVLPINRVLTTKFMYHFPGQTTCRLLSFLNISFPGISGHMLLLISIQRYLLVCKPIRPKMTRILKRLSFGIVCLVTVAYSSPLLFIKRFLKTTVVYMNLNITAEVCTYPEDLKPSLRAYTTILLVIVVTNILLAAGFYIPVLKRISLLFRAKKYKLKKIGSFNSNRGSLYKASRAIVLRNVRCNFIKMRNFNKMQDIDITETVSNPSKRSDEEAHNTTTAPITTMSDIKMTENVSNSTKRSDEEGLSTTTSEGLSSPTEKEPIKRETTSNHRRITIMFFLILVTYVLSYTPPVVLYILFYHLEDFTPLTMTKAETAVWYYMSGLLVLNHIINPLIYGCFDKMFRSQLRQSCQRKT